MTNGNGAPTPDAAPAQAQFGVLVQYIKDFSFENPNAPASLTQQNQPQVSVQINVGATNLGGPDFEVALTTEVKAALERLGRQRAAGGPGRHVRRRLSDLRCHKCPAAR